MTPYGTVTYRFLVAEVVDRVYILVYKRERCLYCRVINWGLEWYNHS